MKTLNSTLSFAYSPSGSSWVSIIFFACLTCFSTISFAQYRTAKAGPYSNRSTWYGNVVPPAGASITIGHAVSLSGAASSASAVTIAAGGSLTVNTSGALFASNALTISGGSLINNGGTINVGTNGGSNKLLKLANGTLSISNGVLNVNGNIVMSAGNFIMSGGKLNVDPNSGNAATSVANGTDVLNISSAVKSTVTGGTITFVDPPYAGTGRTIAYTGNSGNSDWKGNTIIFGGTTGKNTNSGGTNGFNVDTRATGGSYLVLGNVVTNGGSGTNRFISGSANANNGFDIGGNLTLNSGSELRTLKGGAVLRISGDIINSGLFCDLAGVYFTARTGPNTVAQYVKRNPSGLFINSLSPYAATGHFSNVQFNNIARPIAITIENGDPAKANAGLAFGGPVAFINGIVDAGQRTNTILFSPASTATSVNGGLLRNGYPQVGKRFATGSSSFTFYVVDSVGTFDVSPVTINMTANSLYGRQISVNVDGRAHPKLQSNGKPKDYLNRYWRFWGTAGGNFKATITFKYIPKDVTGSTSPLQISRWNGKAWSKYSTAKGSNSLSVNINQATFANGSACDITAMSTATSAPGGRLMETAAVQDEAEIKTEGKVEVYPNPVTSKQLNLRFNSLPTGKYNVGIFSNSGQQVFANSITHSGGISSNSTMLPGSLQPGSYHLVINSDGKQVSTQNIIIAN